MKRYVALVLSLAVVATAGPVVAWATSDRARSSGLVVGMADRQKGAWRTSPATTRRTTFVALTGLQARVCALGEVAATVSVAGTGGPMQLQVHLDYGPLVPPGPVTFTPTGPGTIGSFTYLIRVGTDEGYDGHFFQVEWRSATGRPTTVTSATMNLVYQEGTHRC